MHGCASRYLAATDGHILTSGKALQELLLEGTAMPYHRNTDMLFVGVLGALYRRTDLQPESTVKLKGIPALL